LLMYWGEATKAWFCPGGGLPKYPGPPLRRLEMPGDVTTGVAALCAAPLAAVSPAMYGSRAFDASNGGPGWPDKRAWMGSDPSIGVRGKLCVDEVLPADE